jgi:glycosyltransferase involved in cell wall biosynthesis
MKTVIAKGLSKKSYDCIHIEPFYVYPSLPETTLPIVVSEHNVEYEVYQTYAKKVRFPILKYVQMTDASRIRRAEIEILKRASEVTAVSDEDAEKINRMTHRSDVTVVPNGVDTKYFAFEKKTFDGTKQSFVFIGNFLWMPNKDVLRTLIQNVWPTIRASYPHAELHIVGAHVPGWAFHHADSGVLIDGIIPDVREAYLNADALIAPLTIAGGTKFKILEAMASGCPVITTSEGIEGIKGADVRCVKIASTPFDVSQAISDMYRNPRQWQQMCIHARELVEQQYSWPAIAETLSGVWKEALS